MKGHIKMKSSLISIVAAIAIFPMAARAEASDGGDIWFEDASGAVIPHEVDSWDASGDSFVWVKIPEKPCKQTR